MFGNHARVLVFHAGGFAVEVACQKLREQHVHGLKDVQRFESRDDGGFVVLCGQKVKSLRAHDRGNMPRRDEAVNVGVAAVDERLEWRFDGNVVAEHREVGHVAYAGSLQRCCGGGRGGFEADAKEDDFLGGVFFGELEGIEGRVDEADVGTPRAGLHEGFGGAGHTHHVAEAGENDVGLLGEPQGVVNPAHGQHAYRAAGAVHQFNGAGQ